MRKITMAFALLAVGTLLGCSSADLVSDVELQTVIDPKVDFSGFRTFAWDASGSIVQDKTGDWENPELDVNAEVHFQVDRQMRELGFIPVSRNPDLLVSYVLAASIQDPRTYEDKKGVLKIENLSKGALIVELADAKKGQPIWRGAATARVRPELTSEQRRERLSLAIGWVFDQLPR